ncbi:hypothetical protein [Sideroxydans lithotrophicus]|uniref:Uncharacterized protein n=1 Tax=Sideroxydans lithotrophicus (strain ES-1) TaxID=580332 RepID=D5CUE4_SIDLE|nr:hypothetical protein [Sideroxydans lithotrophicus]ADE10479.1 conserved hypothetical protein [Sideroxydans lithotrophicus ES-1]
MTDLTVKSKLPIGILVDGKRFKDFSIRPGTLRDSINAAQSLGGDAATANGNTLRYATMAQRVSFEGLDQELVTYDLLLGLLDRDAMVLEAASDEVEKKLDALSSS